MTGYSIDSDLDADGYIVCGYCFENYLYFIYFQKLEAVQFACIALQYIPTI